MERKDAAGLAGLLATVLALVVGLHQIGAISGLSVDWSNPIEWIEGSPPELVVGAFLRQIGLIVGYWVLASTALYAVIRFLDAPVPWAQFVMLPVARRLVDRAVAASLAVSMLGSPLIAAANEKQIAFEVSGDGIPVPHVKVIEPPAADPVIRSATVVTGESPSDQASPVVMDPTTDQVSAMAIDTTRVVAKGDNLWTIAADHLSQTAGPAVSPGHIGKYWRSVIEHNQTTLRSGDPNLIYPGEIVALPPIGDSP